MADIADNTKWSQTDASNNQASPNGWPEGMAPSGVNDSARNDKGAVKRFWDRINPTLTTGGTSTAYTLTYAVAPASYATGELFGFVLHTATGAAPTMNINGLGSRNLRKRIASGWSNVAANDFPTDAVLLARIGSTTIDVINAIDPLAVGAAGFVLMSDGSTEGWRAPPIQSNNVLCPHENLTAAQASNSTVTIAADAVVLRNTSGGLKRFAALSKTLNIASSGANGLDTGAEAASTWYHLWAIGKEDGTLDGLLSVSATAPTMPSGYTYKGYIGAVYNNGSSNFEAFSQVGPIVAGPVTSVLSSGAATSFTAVLLTAAVPPTAKQAFLLIEVISTSGTLAAVGIAAATSAGLGRGVISGVSTAGSNNIGGQAVVAMPEAQKVYYAVGGANMSENLYTSGWAY